jgi:hypothetical protein
LTTLDLGNNRLKKIDFQRLTTLDISSNKL